MPVPPWALPLALALVAAIATPAAAAGCQAPYEALPGGLDWQVAPGEVRQFPAGLTIAAGTRVLLEGTANVTGGVTIRGHLFLSSASSSTLAADWVVVEAGGSLQAGSEACPLPPTVSATVLLRNGAVHPQAGRKALAVLAGGTLEVGELSCWAGWWCLGLGMAVCHAWLLGGRSPQLQAYHSCPCSALLCLPSTTVLPPRGPPRCCLPA